MNIDSKFGLDGGVFTTGNGQRNSKAAGPDNKDVDLEQNKTTKVLTDDQMNKSLPMRLKQLQRRSSGIKFILGAFELIFYSPLCSVIWIILLMGTSVACIYFGLSYEGDCPKLPSLKNLLIIFGSFGVSKCALGIIEQICQGLGCGNEMDHDEQKEGFQRHVCLAFVDKIFSVLILLSFIALSVEIFTNLVEDYQINDATLPAYCDPLMVEFSKWLCISIFIAMVLVFFLIIGLIQKAK